MIEAVNASGGCILPFLFFPMLSRAPTETIGAANPSGWSNAEIFKQWPQHFIKHTRCSRELLALSLLDNQDSHLNLAAIEFAKKNGLVMFTFLPHCKNKLQPLDITVYGLLKRYLNDAVNP
ncbi:uncharacterized protein [Watersipora subatra]|uniref:uncharacterized protein n=1 Tax=Watersipora subatra TaxID=2589382 RepID=UPI00355B7F6F